MLSSSVSAVRGWKWTSEPSELMKSWWPCVAESGNEEEAAQDRVQAEKDLKEVRDRLLAAQEEAEKAAKESEINVSVDPALVAQDDSGIDDDLFADIIIPHLFDEFDHEEVIENFNPDLFDLC